MSTLRRGHALIGREVADWPCLRHERSLLAGRPDSMNPAAGTVCLTNSTCPRRSVGYAARPLSDQFARSGRYGRPPTSSSFRARQPDTAVHGLVSGVRGMLSTRTLEPSPTSFLDRFPSTRSDLSVVLFRPSAAVRKTARYPYRRAVRSQESFGKVRAKRSINSNDRSTLSVSQPRDSLS
jgi:hypothetical protein